MPTLDAREVVQTDFYYRKLLDDVTWTRVVGRIIKDHPGLNHTEAEQIMDGTIGFLLLHGHEECPDCGFSPSPMIDIGWHTFLLYTKKYEEFCLSQVGLFVHHEPYDVPGVDYFTIETVDAVEFMLVRDIPFNEKMWQFNATLGPKPKSCGNKPKPCASQCGGGGGGGSCGGGGGSCGGGGGSCGGSGS